ncbi:hypothetical protein Goklo_027795 [Gossypium klotzschianum]|uniref:Sulfotransferase n=1 Tax=Gossypium klotzschianum TaxID=34286 RepID=A0A7J8TZ40_9ROSI|nr:hypothetical protein [Gossypium klotzschianum]
MGFLHLAFFQITFLTLCSTSAYHLVYICRDPKDVLVSKWHFANKVSHYGLFWNHVLGYSKASVESPKKVLFLKYEDVKKEPLGCARKVAEFLGVPFTLEEENKEIVEQIVKLCSFESMSNQEGVSWLPTAFGRLYYDFVLFYFSHAIFLGHDYAQDFEKQ